MKDRARAELQLRNFVMASFMSAPGANYEVASARADDLLRAAIGPLDAEIARLARDLEAARGARQQLHQVVARAALEKEAARERERAIVEACAAVCESRSRSYHREKAPGWLDRALEASKCGSAIREGWRQHLAATPPQEASDA